MVSAKYTNPVEVAARMRSDAALSVLTQYLVDAGFAEAYASEAATVGDISPTTRPTVAPTMMVAVIQSLQVHIWEVLNIVK